MGNILHRLSSQPYSPADGIREKDKKNVHSLLSNVASLRDNVYHLKRHMWEQVSVDWPFYTEQVRVVTEHREVRSWAPGQGQRQYCRLWAVIRHLVGAVTQTCPWTVVISDCIVGSEPCI